MHRTSFAPGRPLLLAALALFVTLSRNASAAFPVVENGAPKATIVVMKAALTAQPDPKPDALWAPQPAAAKIAAAARDL